MNLPRSSPNISESRKTARTNRNSTGINSTFTLHKKAWYPFGSRLFLFAHRMSLLHILNTYEQLHFIRNYYTSCFCYCVPVQAKFFPADLACYFKTSLGLPITVNNLSSILHIEGN